MRTLQAIAATALGIGASPAAEENQGMETYNVIWDSPSEDHNGSMPIGNGDLAANVWVEPNGDLVFYLSKSDAWTGGHGLVKLGRVRVALDPPLHSEGMKFKQELDLETGSIVIDASGKDLERSLRFWIDANHPVVNVEILGKENFTTKATLESWRVPGASIQEWGVPDVIVPTNGKNIRWYQRNMMSVFTGNIEKQHLGHLIGKIKDPLIHRTFGGLIRGEGLLAVDANTLVSEAPSQKTLLRIDALTEQTDTPEKWIADLEAQALKSDALPAGEAWQAHTKWWGDFWDRSYLHITGTDDARQASRAYQLQRWVLACAGRGAYPIKFNGSLFTVDAKATPHLTPDGENLGPDYRRWGGAYWFQNTRHAYWPMLAMGDYDMMIPLFRMYRDMLPLARERSRKYYNHDGVFFPETFMTWGTYTDFDFGRGQPNPEIFPASTYVRYYWTGGLELSTLMLHYYRNTEGEAFIKEYLLPIAGDVVTFYDQHYAKGEDGKILFSPAQVLESWHEAVNPFPEIIGLRAVLTGLLALPEPTTSAEQRTQWARVLKDLPALPKGEKEGGIWFKPADSYGKKHNWENANLYGVWPFQVQGPGWPELDTIMFTYKHRYHRDTGCWRYDAVHAAMLGDTAQAKAHVLNNVTNQFHTIGSQEKANTPPSRFPAFWHTGDWVPDQDHASIIITALQSMLMVAGPKDIRLMTAWPEDWNASFKFHAAGRTTVEGKVEKGKILKLDVSPEARRKDVIITNAE